MSPHTHHGYEATRMKLKLASLAAGLSPAPPSPPFLPPSLYNDDPDDPFGYNNGYVGTIPMTQSQLIREGIGVFMMLLMVAFSLEGFRRFCDALY